MKIKNISQSELEIMNLIWNSEKQLSSKEIINQLNGIKDWKDTTILTFLSRLAEKEFIEVTKIKRHSYYNAIISKNEYIQLETQDFFNKIHNGSIKNFITALHESKDISKEDLDELEKWIKSR